MAHEIDGPVEQHPPVIGRSCLVEQLLTRGEPALLADRQLFLQLIVAQVVEQGNRAQIGGEGSGDTRIVVERRRDRFRHVIAFLTGGGACGAHRSGRAVARH